MFLPRKVPGRLTLDRAEVGKKSGRKKGSSVAMKMASRETGKKKEVGL